MDQLNGPEDTKSITLPGEMAQKLFHNYED